MQKIKISNQKFQKCNTKACFSKWFFVCQKVKYVKITTSKNMAIKPVKLNLTFKYTFVNFYF